MKSAFSHPVPPSDRLKRHETTQNEFICYRDNTTLTDWESINRRVVVEIWEMLTLCFITPLCQRQQCDPDIVNTSQKKACKNTLANRHTHHFEMHINLSLCPHKLTQRDFLHWIKQQLQEKHDRDLQNKRRLSQTQAKIYGFLISTGESSVAHQIWFHHHVWINSSY